ncbi:MAG: diguanylate phosphodiesterase [Pedosphaera sp.]|nr:diguanylate phosphodiesterase [Pedosphaera sp.]
MTGSGNNGMASPRLRVESIALMRWLFLLLGLFCVPSGSAVDEYTSQYEAFPPEVGEIKRMWLKDQMRETQERYRVQVAIPDAVSQDIPPDTSMLPPQSRTEPGARLEPIESETNSSQGVQLGIVFLVAAVLTFRKLGPEISEMFGRKYNPSSISAPAANSRFKVLAEEEAFAEFLTAFNSGTSASAVLGAKEAVLEGSAGEASFVPGGLLGEFLADAPALLLDLGRTFQEISRSPDDAARQKMLRGLVDEIRALKSRAGIPELLPVFQMASALEGLLKQFVERPENITRSTLRTVAGGLDLLKNLCVPGIGADIATNPPIRLLAVDDDSVSRYAISYALTRVFKPDLAEHGAAALALAAAQTYDVIFLDVMMPGMDGFEVCSTIHELSANRLTPVVFVTSLSDFDARAKSTLSGGHDLIGKPFLTYEITVKALTLALRGRLQARAQAPEASRNSPELAALPPTVVETAAPVAAQNQAQPPADVTNDGAGSKVETIRNRRDKPSKGRFADAKRRRRERLASAAVTAKDSLPPSVDRPAGEFVNPLLADPSAYLSGLRDLLPALNATMEDAARQKILVDLYLLIHSVTVNAEHAGLHLASKMSFTLEGLLKKLLENTRHSTASTLQTITTALGLLHHMCLLGLKLEKASNSPIQMLVVDDDALARRAIAGALQLAYDKPDAAQNGEEALALAAKKTFDVIFLDVVMPGMDGFEVCTKIHELSTNRDTPVVFVTSLCDFDARTKSNLCGGSELIAKPFLFAEVSVKALTFALRGRIEKFNSALGDTGTEPDAKAAQPHTAVLQA